MIAISDREFARVVAFVRENYGINLIKKRALVQSRLALDIERRGYASFGGYFDDVISHPGGEECQRMIDKLSTNHTFFFREPACLEHMRGIAVPELIKRGAKRVDIWCAASSAGQECYSIAMTLEDALAPFSGVSYRILGSDINSDVLKTAREGIYSNEELARIPDRFRKRYCLPLGDGRFAVAPALKERVSWRQINLARPLSGLASASFNFVFCRNVMIYFEAATKEALTSELRRVVAEGGYVYVGNTETLDMKRTRFRYLEPAVFETRAVTP